MAHGTRHEAPWQADLLSVLCKRRVISEWLSWSGYTQLNTIIQLPRNRARHIGPAITAAAQGNQGQDEHTWHNCREEQPRTTIHADGPGPSARA